MTASSTGKTSGARVVRATSAARSRAMRAVERAERHVRSAASVGDALRRFAEAVVQVWPDVVHVSVIVAGPDGELQIHPLIPDGAPAPFPADAGSTWQPALFDGERTVLRRAALRAALESWPGTSSAVASRPLTALTIVPLTAAGQVLGALNLGTTAAKGRERRHPDQQLLTRLIRALAQRLLEADESMPPRHEAHMQELRRQVLARLLHDLRTPLSGIGVVTALLEPGTGEVPPDVLDAVRMHHADLLRYVGELADFALLDLAMRLPPAQHVALDEVLEAVLWHVRPYLRRRRQTLHVAGKVERALRISQRHLEQALTAAVFNVSACTREDTPVQIRARAGAAHATVTVAASACTIAPDAVEALFDPYLRARPRKDTAGLMSLAAGRRTLEHYGGGLEVVAKGPRLRIVLTVPLA